MRQAVADRFLGHVAQVAVTLLDETVAQPPITAKDVDRMLGPVAVAPRAKLARVR